MANQAKALDLNTEMCIRDSIIALGPILGASMMLLSLIHI